MLDVVIFSKDRACQLELLLRSIRHHVSDPERLNITVLPLSPVQTTAPNRHGVDDAVGLNAAFLRGRRISLESVADLSNRSAHHEVTLVWEPWSSELSPPPRGGARRAQARLESVEWWRSVRRGVRFRLGRSVRALPGAAGAMGRRSRKR